MSEPADVDRPLSGLRIIDAVVGPLAPLTRYLAELGATVDRFVPVVEDSIVESAANNGKRRVPQAALEAAIAQAHAVVATPDLKLDLAALRRARPSLVTMRVSDFGQDNAFTDWKATDAILHALSGELSRSGIRGREPLLPPGQLAYECSAVQGAFVLVSALYRAVRTAQGDHIDFSALDGAVQALDPGFGISGSATLGKPAHLLSRNRPARGFQYPILRCSDGYVRICLLAKRQWQGMFRWMGEPAEFAGSEFEKTAVRYKAPNLLPAIASFFAERSRAELETEGQQFGVPIAGVLTFGEALAVEHLRERQALTHATLPGGRTVTLPNGVVSIDGVRMGPGRTSDVQHEWPAPERGGALPFKGLRVLDLGVIVVGAEQGRLLADGGADVVKVESRAYPDGNRQSYLTYGMSLSFAAGHRNKRSLGINLRDPAGRDLLLELVRTADVVLSNFKPGTLESLGLGYDELAAANSRIVVSDSSAFGATGPWRARMGYGPLVRAATGLTLQWRYPNDSEGFCDTVTIYPDHVAGRVSAIATVALLLRRLRTDRGGSASVAQAEVMLSHFAAEVARASLGLKAGAAADWPWRPYCAPGDDEWVVITVRGDDDWARLSQAIGLADEALTSREDRLASKDMIDAAVQAWLAQRSAAAAESELQAVGVPAARMLRVADLPNSAYFRERGFFRVETHPYLREDVVAERWAAKAVSAVDTPLRPAPLVGEHSEEVVYDWLVGRVDPEPLVAVGVLEPTDHATLSEAQRGARESRVIQEAERA